MHPTAKGRFLSSIPSNLRPAGEQHHDNNRADRQPSVHTAARDTGPPHHSRGANAPRKSAMGNRKTPLLLRQQKCPRQSHSGVLKRHRCGEHTSHHRRQRRMVGERGTPSTNRENCILRGCQATTSRHKHPEASPGAAKISLTCACITPLALAHQLFTAPYLSPLAASRV